MAGHVERFLARSMLRAWDPFVHIPWVNLAPERLTRTQRRAVEFITMIEDHLPGYFAAYSRRFPVDDSVDSDEFEYNREFYHFAVRWAQEEDCHAYVLFKYQVDAGIAGPGELRRSLSDQGRKRFDVPYTDSLQVFTYTFLQEKITQLYYQQLSRVVEEPVLRTLLRLLARDEGRHFVFFADVMRSYLDSSGMALLPAIREVVQTFKMPLAETLDHYRSWAMRAAAAVGGHDPTKAMDELVRLVHRTCDGPTRSTSLD
ncbi:MAG: acyl-ACP desaturase, partial [Actinomycetota bacterium]|nr:acyl-ACP desaturase [Actinomycetota bacterium]